MPAWVRGCNKNTHRADVFPRRILSACLSQPVVTVVQVETATLSRTDSSHTRGCLARKCSRHLSPCRTPHTQGTCTPSLSLTQTSSPTSHRLLSELQPCADQRLLLSCALAERPSLIGYEPKQLPEYQDFAEHEDLCLSTNRLQRRPTIQQ